jgi:hypothetical protein
MEGVLYEIGPFNFLLVTVVMGGAAAWMTGRAAALTWSSYIVLAVYLMLLTWAVRFLHMALFGSIIPSIAQYYIADVTALAKTLEMDLNRLLNLIMVFYYYVIDLIVIAIIGWLGYRYTRASQMTSRYGWLFAASGPLSWEARKGS